MGDPFDLEKDNFLAWYHNATAEDFALAKKNNAERLEELMEKYASEIELMALVHGENGKGICCDIYAKQQI